MINCQLQPDSCEGKIYYILCYIYYINLVYKMCKLATKWNSCQKQQILSVYYLIQQKINSKFVLIHWFNTFRTCPLIWLKEQQRVISSSQIVSDVKLSEAAVHQLYRLKSNNQSCSNYQLLYCKRSSMLGVIKDYLILLYRSHFPSAINKVIGLSQWLQPVKAAVWISCWNMWHHLRVRLS